MSISRSFQGRNHTSDITRHLLNNCDVRKQDWFYPFDYENPTYNGTGLEGYYEESPVEDSEVSEWTARNEINSYLYPIPPFALFQVACFENYAVFCVSAFQYIILAYAFSKSTPYRKFIYTNLWLVASLLLLTAFTVYLVLYPAE